MANFGNPDDQRPLTIRLKHLKPLVWKEAARRGIDPGTWVRRAIVEKLERDTDWRE